jgi:hypothetical protein
LGAVKSFVDIFRGSLLKEKELLSSRGTTVKVIVHTNRIVGFYLLNGQ